MVAGVRFIAPAAILLFAATPAAALSRHGWDQASSVGRDALVVAALGVPAAQGDWRGDGQAALSIGGAFAVTELVKRAIPEERPDRSNDKSFPSGHTSVSFAAAATLEKRYGWQVGIPAHVVAAFVGVARVEAKKHFVHDVLVGAAVGEASGWLLTSKRDAKVQWLPFADSQGGGATVAMRF
jgi:membrane-associated phospholipid phosphatase